MSGVSIGQLLTETIPEPTRVIGWDEDIPADVMEAMRKGETVTVLGKDGQPSRVILMDYFGTIRERLLR